MSMPSGRERKFHTRGAKTPLLQALEEVFHNSLLLRNTDKHPLIGVIFCGFRYSLDHLAKNIEAKFSAKGLHIKMTANYFSQVTFGFWFPQLLLEI